MAVAVVVAVVVEVVVVVVVVVVVAAPTASTNLEIGTCPRYCYSSPSSPQYCYNYYYLVAITDIVTILITLAVLITCVSHCHRPALSARLAQSRAESGGIPALHGGAEGLRLPKLWMLWLLGTSAGICMHEYIHIHTHNIICMYIVLVCMYMYLMQV